MIPLSGTLRTRPPQLKLDVLAAIDIPGDEFHGDKYIPGKFRPHMDRRRTQASEIRLPIKQAERKILRQAVISLDDDVLSALRLEPLGLDLKNVVAGLECCENETARVIRLGSQRHVTGRVCKGESCVWYGGVLRVDQRTGERSRCGLRQAKIQPYETMLDEMVESGYTGTELGPYGYFPTDADVLRPVLQAKGLKMLSSFVPVDLANPDAAAGVIEQIRTVGSLLAALGAPCIVMADAQSKQRENVAGRVPPDGSMSLTVEQWKNVARVCADAERVASEFGLDLVFHPHVATHVETPAEVELFFDAISATKIGLCLDTGHCYYGGGDPTIEVEKYKALLRYIHIKDIAQPVLDHSNRKELNFDQAVEVGVFSTIGEGCVDFPAFFATLYKNGYDGWCVVEQDVKFGATPVLPNDSMAASVRYLRGVVGRLNALIAATTAP